MGRIARMNLAERKRKMTNEFGLLWEAIKAEPWTALAVFGPLFAALFFALGMLFWAVWGEKVKARRLFWRVFGRTFFVSAGLVERALVKMGDRCRTAFDIQAINSRRWKRMESGAEKEVAWKLYELASSSVREEKTALYRLLDAAKLLGYNVRPGPTYWVCTEVEE